jgi:hypothetical protein
VAVVGTWLSFVLIAQSRSARMRVQTLNESHPVAFLRSAQVAATTNRSLRRIAKAKHSTFSPVKAYYTVVAEPGALLLVTGSRRLQTVVTFRSDEVRDVRVGSTSWVFANYTTLFFGITAEQTVYELPVRINCPTPTSLRPADKVLAGQIAERMISTIRSIG